MEKQLFHDGWTCRKKGDSQAMPVLLPHDAMIHEIRSSKAAGGGAHAYFPGGVYIYEKRFMVPEEWKEKHMMLEFEGVYRNCSVALNGKELKTHKYGYTPFTVDLDRQVKYGQENVLTVMVDNSEMPNSRWYSGSGIYRPVHLYLGETTHIAHQGVRIQTLSISPAKIKIEVDIEATSETLPDHLQLEIRIKNHDNREILKSRKELQNLKESMELEIPGASLWEEDHPYLYTCEVRLIQEQKILDEAEELFGIREISWSPKGLFVNGKEVLLRGGCVHHDNGILGAATWEKSEERRVRIMKEQGFNAIRSSHNPASDAMVRACDRYGMYLMDETFDMWYVRKSKYDYGRDFRDNWKEDVKAMVERDYNHPSVIMYSIGNEVSEPGKQDGVKQGKEIISYIKSLDDSRAVTGGMNLMIMGNYAKGKGQYDNVDQADTQSHKAGKSANQEETQETKNASLAFNIIASVVGPGMNKAGNSKKVDAVTSPILDALDIAGYNYGSGRYPLEGKAHPDRVIFGSETFPQDIYKNWEMVKQYPYLIGDFMWTSWDYLGEAGIGAWSYSGGMPFNRPYPWILGGAGVIDILGNPDISCRNAQVVWEQIKQPVIGVRPVNHPGVRVSKSVWRGTNAVESWSWKDCEGNKALVEVYTKEPAAELFINDKSVGKKKTKKAVAVFKTRYERGTIKAVTYDQSGNQTGCTKLQSADGALSLVLEPEERKIQVGDIVYIPVSVRGENGIVESNADCLVEVSVENGVLLAFGSASACTEERYDSGRFTTYQGRALAVVYAAKKGPIEIKAEAEGFVSGSAQIEAV